MRTNRMFRARRLVWRVRRSVPRLARPVSRVLPAAAPPVAPVLILGCPRSGTTLLLRALLAGGELRSVQAEGHILWDEFHHPRERDWESDALAASDVGDREREYVYRAIRWYTRSRRFVDKTPESCLRVPYLDALFPDATYIFLRRRAAANISSLMEAWRARPRFVKYRLPEPLTGLGELDGSLWSLVLVPGWRELRAASLEEICARQYAACNEAVLAARDRVARDHWVDVAYEDLVESPVPSLEQLCARLGLEFSPAARAHAERVSSEPTSTTLTAPGHDKWRGQNREAVERVLPLVEGLERRLGYAASRPPDA